MSLPRSFDNEETYFTAAVDFLHRYSWVYREANTSCLKSLDAMPCDFQDYFLGLANENLNTFPFVHEHLDGCPQIVQHFRQEAANLTPTPTAAPVPSCDTSNHYRKMATKKQHEIEQLAANIHKHCADRTQLIIDLGSGLGYLSEALFKLNGNYLILGLEADERRVESARKRCRELMPQEANKSISYQQLFITAADDSCARIAEHAKELGAGGLSTTIIGLHACADLSISAMLLFLAMPQVRCLHIMPCCYHKLALSEPGASAFFRNFPLSQQLSKAVSNEAAVACFNRPFMRLACQQTNSRWRCDNRQHDEHGHRMFVRALAEVLTDPDELVKVKRCDKTENTTQQDEMVFQHLQQRYQLYSLKTKQPLDWRPIHETRFAELNSRYSAGRGARLAEALCCLQASIQQLCENVVLYDRLCHLKELAAARQLGLEVRYEKLFDEQVSPRCQVLIAEKL